MLGDGTDIDLKRVHVIVVAGDDHVVPLVVIERLVRVSFHQRRAVSQVKDVMDEPAVKTPTFVPDRHLSSTITAPDKEMLIERIPCHFCCGERFKCHT